MEKKRKFLWISSRKCFVIEIMDINTIISNNMTSFQKFQVKDIFVYKRYLESYLFSTHTSPLCLYWYSLSVIIKSVFASIISITKHLFFIRTFVLQEHSRVIIKYNLWLTLHKYMLLNVFTLNDKNIFISLFRLVI